MKVRSINIPNLFHFKNFHLDLTYPAGHEKAGKPLDKVCIIGQSGTGKTTLLKLLSILSYNSNRYSSVASLDLIKEIDLQFELGELSVTKHLELKKDSDTEVTNMWRNQSISGLNVEFEKGVEIWQKFKESKNNHSIYFPAELDYSLEVDSYTTMNLEDRLTIDFSSVKAVNAWQIILKDIQKYQEEEIKLRQEISKVAENFKDVESIQKAVKKLDNWRKKSFNPVLDIAERCLNPLLIHFGLRVKTKLDFQGKDDIGFVKIEDLNGNEVPNGLLSTGTKQVMLSALPLYLLKPDKCLIFYDEPERSLYPDIQRIIIDYYLSLTTDSQFFFATHSPIIASSFEPWEIVELKFDKKWNVYRDKYYEGENHVDNYFVDPRYLDYDLILKKVFDLKDTSTDLRMEALVELTMLKNQLDQLKQEGKLQTKKAKDILLRYKSLAKKLAWKTE
ncbi:AAA family ATPase [Chitinophaga sp. S165]|uniref:AAA family ATPase n=1 Tax=Chitinophaga sp. S165 TaxID=2135462 RepID=UPI000D7150D6|nr:AAA family ATPase [Chitinophaga sp. S165]PWV57061.1 putative AbiEii toxin of type IV toxin-antitoxin system [Chitinophaga sp. S165]